MLIWVVCWLVTEILYFLTLSPLQFQTLKEGRLGVFYWTGSLAFKFLLWPFWLAAIVTEIVLSTQDKRTRFNYWWFNLDDIKL